MANQLPKIIIPGNKPKEWTSSGVTQKPPYCNASCRFAKTGSGFVPDTYGKDAKVVLLFPYPSSDDLMEQRGLSGKMGWWIFKSFIEPAGFFWENVIVSHLLRCKPPRRGKDILYPLAELRKHTEKTCRKFDCQHGEGGKLVTGGVETFSPDIAILTFDPRDVKQVPAYHRQIMSDVAKAMYFVKKGNRPLIAFGAEPAEYAAPFIRTPNGGLKAWRGTWVNYRKEGLLITDQKKPMPLLINIKTR